MLIVDETRVFEYPTPNHIGIIRLVRTDDGICFKQRNSEDKKRITYTPIGIIL